MAQVCYRRPMLSAAKMLYPCPCYSQRVTKHAVQKHSDSSQLQLTDDFKPDRNKIHPVVDQFPQGHFFLTKSLHKPCQTISQPNRHHLPLDHRKRKSVKDCSNRITSWFGRVGIVWIRQAVLLRNTTGRKNTLFVFGSSRESVNNHIRCNKLDRK